jgi:phosphonate transport system permease protein
MATVLGFVGAGGLGQMLYVSLSLFKESEAASVLIAMLVIVALVDGLSAWLRERLAD